MTIDLLIGYIMGWMMTALDGMLKSRNLGISILVVLFPHSGIPMKLQKYFNTSVPKPSIARSLSQTSPRN
jgi:hypothetical protein